MPTNINTTKMTNQEIKQAIKKGTTLIWNDPDPIEGNDYTITKVFALSDETASIQYGGSEAEVYLHEITIK